MKGTAVKKVARTEMHGPLMSKKDAFVDAVRSNWASDRSNDGSCDSDSDGPVMKRPAGSKRDAATMKKPCAHQGNKSSQAADNRNEDGNLVGNDSLQDRGKPVSIKIISWIWHRLVARWSRGLPNHKRSKVINDMARRNKDGTYSLHVVKDICLIHHNAYIC